MPSPNQQLATLRPDLSESLEQFDLAASWAGFVAAKIAKPLDVKMQAGNWGVIPLNQMLQKQETSRAPGSNYKRGSWQFDYITYATQGHGFEEPLDDDEAVMYANYFAGERICANRARDAVLRNLETRVIGLFNTTNIPATTAVATSWKTTANSVPVTDITVARTAVRANSGLMCNAVIMGWNAWNNFRNSADLINRIKYWGGDNPKMKDISPDVAAAYLDVDQVFIAGGVFNSNSEGQAAAISSLWNDDTVFVGRLATGDDPKEPCIARILHWGGGGSNMQATIESYREEAIRSNVIRARMHTDEKCVYGAAGYLLTGANQ